MHHSTRLLLIQSGLIEASFDNDLQVSRPPRPMLAVLMKLPEQRVVSNKVSKLSAIRRPIDFILEALMIPGLFEHQFICMCLTPCSPRHGAIANAT